MLPLIAASAKAAVLVRGASTAAISPHAAAFLRLWIVMIVAPALATVRASRAPALLAPGAKTPPTL
jgi:hypothetical protein